MTVLESPAWSVIERMSDWFQPVDADTSERLVRAQCIAPVAQAVAALSRVRDDLVTDITQVSQGSYASDDRGTAALYKVLVYNNYPSGWGSIDARPDHSDVWGPLADLGLAAMTLEVTLTLVGLRSAVTLVLPGWSRSRDSNASTLNLLRFTSDGLWGVKSCALYRRDENGLRTGSAMPLKLTMDYFLGTGTPVNHPHIESFTGDVQLLGFPGAYEYLQKNLPNLAQYLLGLVEMYSEVAARRK